MTTRRALGAAAAVLAAPTLLRAQGAWPGDRPIEVIVPYPPGGGVDTMARIVLPFVAQHVPAARFVVTNRAGAGGQVGFEAIFNAAPDGHTLGALAVPAISTFPLERQVRYRPLDFSFLANVVDDPSTVYVAAGSPVRTLQDLVQAAKARPGRMDYGTTGVGSDDHLLMLGLEGLAGLQPMTHAPFAGAAPLLAQVLGGHIELGVGNMAEILAAMREGRVRALGQAARAVQRSGMRRRLRRRSRPPMAARKRSWESELRRLDLRMLKPKLRSLAKTPGLMRMRERSSPMVTSRL